MVKWVISVPCVKIVLLDRYRRNRLWDHDVYCHAVSRFIILFLFLIWTAWPGDGGREAPLAWGETGLFLGVFALIVLALGVWSRTLARRVTGRNLHRSVKRFNRAVFAARLAVPVWFAAGVFVLQWGTVVEYLLGPVARWPAQLPGAALATAPALLAWMGLWWSQYPADRALREQGLLALLEDGLPVHAPPTLREYLRSNVRLQLLFTLVPVALILLARDAMVMGLWASGQSGAVSELTDASVSLAAALLVLVFAPEILRRVLRTQPLPASPLRDRLEALCRRSNLRYRQILLWHTENNMGNAAVMGLLPQVRYILLSDLLLESMRDEQIEAVFAHEVGHVVHRHLGWYVVFFVILLLAATGASATLSGQLAHLPSPPDWMPPELLITALSVGAFFVAFGFISRRFERQADVFAARTLERARRDDPDGIPLVVPDGREATGSSDHVGTYGANVFASALQRVAAINNIPVASRSWCHGSIATRMQYLQDLASNPAHTRRFDAFMAKLYAGMVLALVACCAWVFAT